MKHLLLSLLLVLAALNHCFSQKSLTNSRTSSAYTYIYKLTGSEAYHVAANPKTSVQDELMHTKIDSFYNAKGGGYHNRLPYGSYLYVSANKNELHYRLVSQNNVHLQFVNNKKDFQFVVTDLRGNLIPDAQVKLGKHKTIKYDPKAKLYTGPSNSKDKVITVLHDNVYNYFGYSEEETYKPNVPKKVLPFFRKMLQPKTKSSKSDKVPEHAYAGYMVFNKPKYKPLDTVKFKAYLLTTKGKSIHDKPLQAVLFKHSTGNETLLATLKPYHEGGYEYSFVLADSLQLKLDRSYAIVLKEQDTRGWKEIYRGSFKYEDYELKSVNFSVRTDKNEQRPGSPVTVFMKAADENDLAVPDGRVEVIVRANNVSNFYDSKVFVKDSLWKTNIVLDPVGETKLVLPDSIFPKADLDLWLSFVFLNSNNERRTASKPLKYFFGNQELNYEFKKDSLQFDYVQKGRSISQKATIVTSYPNTGEKDSIVVVLPAAVKVNYQASGYTVKISDRYHKHIDIEDLNPSLAVNAIQGKDSLRIVVDNSHNVPFWYTVFSGDKVFSKGYGFSLDTIFKHDSSQPAHVRLNYFWGEKELNTETSAFYQPNVLNLKLLAPELVYPGQTVNMQVKVTDVNNQPVPDTDVTAYAHTSKFQDSYYAGIPNFGKRFLRRKTEAGFETDALNLSGQMKLRWDKWGKALNLDTIEYYRFTQVKELYVLSEEGNDPHSPVVSPFVMKDGQTVPVHIVYIDDVPVYFDQAQQLHRYAFKVSPGPHRISMRTTDRLISLDEYDFIPGKKTIISVNADVHNSKVSVRVVPIKLTEEESSLLTQYMIRIERNFDGEKTVLTADSSSYMLSVPEGNPVWIENRSRLAGQRGSTASSSLLVGPIAENYLTFNSGTISQTFLKEPGFSYTFLPGLLKQKSYPSTYGFDIALSGLSDPPSYTDYPLKNTEIDSIWNAYLDLRSSTTTLFNNRMVYNRNHAGLKMKLDTSISNHMPYLKNVIIFRYDQPDFLHIYSGNTTNFNRFEPGEYRMMYLFKDNRYFFADNVQLIAGGLNYFEWKQVKILAADSLSRKIDQQIKSVNPRRNDASISAQQNILQNVNQKYLDPTTLTGMMTGRVVDAKTRTPLPGVLITIKGAYLTAASGIDGRFQLKVPKRGKVIFSSIGYDSKEANVVNGEVADILMDEATASLEEVVVVGYGVHKKESLTGSISTVQSFDGLLAGRVAGIGVQGSPGANYDLLIRGNTSITAGQKPLIIIDGLPYLGNVDSIDPNSIAYMDVLKNADATAIYGARGAAGVIIIKTKGGSARTNISGELVQQQQTMRTNFSDYAFWQPKLLTDAEGKASFKVKFPDDITSWKTRLIAMNGHKQGGIAETTIKSFKTLSANFVSPSFALAGDSINVMGKLMNYSHTDEVVRRKFSYNETPLLDSQITFKNTNLDTVSIIARGAGLKVRPEHLGVIDSLQFEYTMQQDNGYFDGEIRKIPLFQTGVTETKGYFDVLMRDTSITYKFKEDLGKVTLRAEASPFPALLDEMEKLRNYEYLCNEQLASKLKTLLLEKTVRNYLGENFKEEKNIRDLLRKLQSNRRPEGTWGWWQNSSEELWISLHVTEALLEAQKHGYEVNLDKDKLYRYLLGRLSTEKHFDQIHAVKLLRMLNDKHYLNDWISAIEKQRAEREEKNKRDRKADSNVPAIGPQSLYEKLQLMQLRQQAGMPVDFEWLLKQKSKTMFGNSYWGREGSWFWDNSIQNTLLAYQILKTNGNYRDELDGIQRYFLEQRKDGQWRNTYESSLILQTILPELLIGGKKPEPAAIMLNHIETITSFPFTKTVDPTNLTIHKKGDSPLYLTAYQQFNNPSPQKVSKDFSVRSYFKQDGEEVKYLKAGVLATLMAEVTVHADADYVMIEIPIPAGCSYENKTQNFWGVETHREYFKQKTAIFCTKLKKGNYSFSVQLMPRYSGSFVLNPAKAEMMYFPVFYGREEMKRITIQ